MRKFKTRRRLAGYDLIMETLGCDGFNRLEQDTFIHMLELKQKMRGYISIRDFVEAYNFIKPNGQRGEYLAKTNWKIGGYSNKDEYTGWDNVEKCRYFSWFML